MKILIQPVESFPEDERQNFFHLWLLGLDNGVDQCSALVDDFFLFQRCVIEHDAPPRSLDGTD